jgi:hypothetical protein
MALSLLRLYSHNGMSDELETVWKEAVYCLINLLSQHFLGRTKETQDTCHISWCPDPDLN